MLGDVDTETIRAIGARMSRAAAGVDEAVGMIDAVPLDELPEFRARFEAATRDLSRPLGRRGTAMTVLAAIDARLAEGGAG